mgnify:FL=1
MPIAEVQALLSLSTAVKKQDQTQVKHSPTLKKKQVGRAIIKVPRQKRKQIELFFYDLKNRKAELQQYRKDWGNKIKPQSDQGRLNRWRFAFCTVHTPWLRSCEQYHDISNLYQNIQLDSLVERLSRSAGGMFKIKGEGINNLHKLWDTTHQLFELDGLSSRHEWRKARNKLTNKLIKLGLAKTSFALEMLQPLNAKIICIDRHMFKAFGWANVDRSATKEQYEYFEDYWLDLCETHNVEPAISRNYYWDIIQKQSSSMYWGKYLKDYDYTIHTTLN